MQSICELVLGPLKACSHATHKRSIEKVVSGLEEILSASESFLLSLKQHTEYETKEDLSACQIGALLVNEMRHLHGYETYFAHIKVVQDELPEILLHNRELAAAVATASKRVPDPLMLAKQRLPLYKLLFATILKYSDSSLPDYKKILEAEHYLQTRLEKIDSFMRIQSGLTDLEYLDSIVTSSSDPVSFKTKSIFGTTRRLLQAGYLKKLTPGRPNVLIFLFNDVLLVTKADKNLEVQPKRIFAPFLNTRSEQMVMLPSQRRYSTEFSKELTYDTASNLKEFLKPTKEVELTVLHRVIPLAAITCCETRSQSPLGKLPETGTRHEACASPTLLWHALFTTHCTTRCFRIDCFAGQPAHFSIDLQASSVAEKIVWFDAIREAVTICKQRTNTSV